MNVILFVLIEAYLRIQHNMGKKFKNFLKINEGLRDKLKNLNLKIEKYSEAEREILDISRDMLDEFEKSSLEIKNLSNELLKNSKGLEFNIEGKIALFLEEINERRSLMDKRINKALESIENKEFDFNQRFDELKELILKKPGDKVTHPRSLK